MAAYACLKYEFMEDEMWQSHDMAQMILYISASEPEENMPNTYWAKNFYDDCLCLILPTIIIL